MIWISIWELVDDGGNDGRDDLQANHDQANDVHDELQPVDVSLPDQQVDITHNDDRTEQEIQVISESAFALIGHPARAEAQPI